MTKKKLMSLSDLAFTKHVNRVYDERLVVPPRGTWKSRAERDAARLEIVDVLKRLKRKVDLVPPASRGFQTW